MASGISAQARLELLQALRERYREASRREKGRILDEFVAVAKCHRKHAVRLLGHPGEESTAVATGPGRRVYDEAVREALVVLWEASDRICGKRLKAVAPALIGAVECHGHLEFDAEARERLVSVSAATIDRLLAPVRREAGSRRRRRGKRGRSRRGFRFAPSPSEPSLCLDSSRPILSRTAAARCPVRTSTLWSPPTYARAGPRRSHCWFASSPWSYRESRRSRNSFPCRFAASTSTTTRHFSTRRF